jgi:uncharacterized protein
MPNMSGRRIVIPGGSGHIGRFLARAFLAQGDCVTVLSRRPNVDAPWKTVLWNGMDPGNWMSELDGPDIVINLAGRSVNCRHTRRNQIEMMDSRVRTTQLVGEAIANAARPPSLWINASTATIYRHALDRAMDEATGEIGGAEPDAPSAWHSSIDVAASWERAFFASHTPATRKVALRSALVMAPGMGGVFDQFCGLVRMGLGGTIGTSDQFVSWIHYLDFVRAVRFIIANQEPNQKMDGCINVCAPHPLPNRDFMQALREACGAPFGIAASGRVLKLGAVLWRTETELLLKSRRVVPARLLEAGFEFLYREWPPAARDLAGERGVSRRFGRFAGASRW